jgi:prophage antirepressor-like protein
MDITIKIDEEVYFFSNTDSAISFLEKKVKPEEMSVDYCRILYLREISHLTLQDIANMLGYTKSSYFNILNKERRNFPAKKREVLGKLIEEYESKLFESLKG